MRIFVAGASGTIGVPLVRALLSAGHHVTAMTRTPEKRGMLKSLGAAPVVADAFDADTLTRVVVGASPTHVIHQLTALPKAGVRRARDVGPTNRLRVEGTRNLIAAAIAAGAHRIVGGSFALLAPPSGRTTGSDETEEAAAAVESMESQLVDASQHGSIESIILRYGLFYGMDNPGTRQMIALVRRRLLPVVRHDRGLLPMIHLEDAVGATVAALTHGATGSVYDIVDDRPVSMTEILVALADRLGVPRPLAVPSWLPRLVAPYLARLASVRLTLSNAKARADLGWKPAYSSIHEGLAATLSSAA